MKNFIALLVLSFVLFSCATDEEMPTTSNFNVAKNETFKINLVGSGSSPYRWKWSNKDDVKIADTLGVEYVPFVSDPQVLGSGGTLIWTFKAIKTGRQILKFDYLSISDSNSSIDTKTFSVNVK